MTTAACGSPWCTPDCTTPQHPPRPDLNTPEGDWEALWEQRHGTPYWRHT